MLYRVNVKSQSVSAAVALLMLSTWAVVRAQTPPDPSAAAVTAAQPAATDFQLSPLHGQDDEQQWFDRYGCDREARQQSGYDPVGERSGPAPPAASAAYVRAMTACLGRHGYEVRYAPPASASPATAPMPTERGPRPHPPREIGYRPLSLQAAGGYSAAVGSTSRYVRDGATAGGALNWFPSAALPVGLRIDGSYAWFKAADQLLARNGVGYTTGNQQLYGGDIDLRVNLLPLPSRQQWYLIAGGGWYRTNTTLQKLVNENLCGTRFCGVFQSLLAQEHDKSGWEPSWNAGLGWEIALDQRITFFAEAHYRYIHRSIDGGGMQLVPIWLGLRF